MQLDSPFVLGYAICLAGVLGLVMGSFLNCLAWRMTHRESVLHGRSHCTTCGHVLGPRDLVPVLSWVFSRGRCRYCGERVSWRYPATELFTAIVYVSLVLRYGLTLETIELVSFASVLLVLSLTDLDEYVIPNATIVTAIFIRVAYAMAMGATGQIDMMAMLRDSLIGGVAVAVPILLLALVMDRVLGRESLGGGDVKLLFVAGIYFGWQQCLFLIIVACVLGLLLALLGVNGGGEGDDTHLIPFGPSIALACWVTMLLGEPAMGWYIGLFMG